eukprot:7208994-Karenia_brevis.AAC.1
MLLHRIGDNKLGGHRKIGAHQVTPTSRELIIGTGLQILDQSVQLVHQAGRPQVASPQIVAH